MVGISIPRWLKGPVNGQKVDPNEKLQFLVFTSLPVKEGPLQCYTVTSSSSLRLSRRHPFQGVPVNKGWKNNMVYDNIHSLTGQMLRLRDNFLIDKEATANPGLKTTSVLKGNEKRPFVLKEAAFPPAVNYRVRIISESSMVQPKI